MLLHHDSTARDLCSVTYPQEVGTGNNQYEGAEPMVLHWWRANRQWDMWTEMGFWVEVDVEGRWQTTHLRWGEVSAASCHVGFVARWKIRTASLGLLAGPHYATSSEVTHWGRLSLLLLPPASVSLISCRTFICFLLLVIAPYSNTWHWLQFGYVRYLVDH